MDYIDTFEHVGLHVRIVHDEDTEFANPRDYDGNLGKMFCDYRGYVLGDSDAPDPRDADDITVEGMVAYLKREFGARVVLPLFVYEHSGITMRAGGRLDTGDDNMRAAGRFMGDDAGWDTSTVGMIFDTAETRKECECEDWDDERIEQDLRESVAYYAAYLEGNVYGYVVVDNDENVLESCWGYLELNVFDDDAYVRQAGRADAEVCARAIERERIEAAEMAARDIITIDR